MSSPTRNLLVLFLLLLPAVGVSTGSQHLAVCYNFGCKVQGTAILTENDLDLLRGIFEHLKSAEEERGSIRRAIAMMEQMVGRQLPSGNDVGGNYKEGMAEIGQMDCIDESTNTTTYLTFLQHQGLLQWHVVEKRAYRAPFILDQHWAAQIRERQSGQHYVVDSWFNDNGKPPLIQTLEAWLTKRPPK